METKASALSAMAVDAQSAQLVEGLYHPKYPIAGVQFHPESVITPIGAKIIKNWLEN